MVSLAAGDGNDAGGADAVVVKSAAGSRGVMLTKQSSLRV